MYFQLTTDHSYLFNGHEYQLGEQFLVRMPDRVFGMFDEITFPDFSALTTAVGWKWVIMFSLIGTLESMLSAKAVDMIDPYQRKTNLDRDNLAVGLGNATSSINVIEALKQRQTHPSALVREHVDWALAQHGINT